MILFGVPNPFIIYILKGFMDSLPGSYFDAARIEGASELRVFWIVVIPLITASLAVAVLLIFLGSWNAFFWPFIVLNTPKKYTFPVALYYLTALVDSQNPAQQFVFGVVSSLPTFVRIRILPETHGQRNRMERDQRLVLVGMPAWAAYRGKEGGRLARGALHRPDATQPAGTDQHRRQH